MQIFADLCAKRGLTIVLITHERDIAAYGTRTVDFKDGLIVSDVINSESSVSSAAPFDSKPARSASAPLTQGKLA
jgi:putative ABC transport system ATP-binding protein